jgi:hypothetical protein
VETLSNTTNVSQYFRYNLSDAPKDPSSLMAKSNEFMGGGLAFGMIGTLWLIILTSLLYRNYQFLPALLAANTVTTFASFILFLGGYLSGTYPLVLAVGTAGTVFYSSATRP